MPAQPQGEGIYFDGQTGARHPVTLKLEEAAILISEGRKQLARWDYTAIEQLPSSAERLRLALADSPSTARLEVRDPAFAEVVKQQSGFGTPQHLTRDRRRRRLVVVWSAAAAAAVMSIGVVGLPAIAEMLTPLVPPTSETRIGDLAHKSALQLYGIKGRVECGYAGARERAGHVAFQKLFRQLDLAANLPIPVRAFVIRTDIINATAFPGGIMHFNKGIIEFTESPDELAGIIGHELGHLAHRHGLRRILHGLGLGYLLAMMTGDVFTGGGVILATHTALDRRHTRAQEREADVYGMGLIAKIGADNHATADFWDRLANRPGNRPRNPAPRPPPPTLLSYTHPGAGERADAIRAAPRVENPKPLLTAQEWQALRLICSGS